MKHTTIQSEYVLDVAELLDRLGLAADYGPNASIKVAGQGRSRTDPKPGNPVFGTVAVSIRQQVPAGSVRGPQ